MAYKEVSPLGKAKKFETIGQVVEGKLERVQEEVPPNDSTIYTIDGQEYWGANALDPLMKAVKIGQKVKITLLDLNFKFPNGRVGKNFKVEVDE